MSQPKSQPERPPSLKSQLSYKVPEFYATFRYYLLQYNILGLEGGYMASKRTFTEEGSRNAGLLAIQPPDEDASSRIFY